MSLSREELLDQLKVLELRRLQVKEGDHSEYRKIKVQMRLVHIELSKLKTIDWRDNQSQFCRAFKYVAKGYLDDETYTDLVNETVLWLKQRHRKKE